MKNLLNYKVLTLILFFFLSFKSFAMEFVIEGNEYTDDAIVLSIINKLPNEDKKNKSNYILKELNNSGLFESVVVSYDEDYYYIKIKEYPSINKFIYNNNERIKDDEINNIINQLEISTFSDKNIYNLINELKIIYQSFGYNNIQIEYNVKKFSNNSIDVNLNFNEGKITKIKSINIIGNKNFDKNIILSKILSKTKNLKNIFANNNFKLFQIENDAIRILNFYKNKGYKDVSVKFNVEYFSNNKAIINYIINEGEKFYLSKFNIKNYLQPNDTVDSLLKILVNKNESLIDNPYSIPKLNELEITISNVLENAGIQYYSIKLYKKFIDNKADILIEISPTEIVYLNQIILSGNTRTYDYAIRRELNIVEGDPINQVKLKEIKRNLNRLPFVGNVDIKLNEIDKNLKDLNINIEEKQTGSFNVGLSIGTLDGASFVSGLKETNINGTGRTVEFLINTNTNNKEFTLSTADKFFISNDIVHKYSTIYRENDFSTSKSYLLNTLSLDTSFNYLFSNNTYHTIGFGYSLKDYKITDESKASNNIISSSGESISFNLNNNITRNNLNSFIRPTKGGFISFNNFFETPSSSSNGFIKTSITGKKYYEINNNVLSLQGRAGNIFSINDNEIMSDNKFSLGGRWLRGFDNFGAGPRNSRNSYVGGNNLLTAKIDFSKPLTLNDKNPIYLNLFNDYGILWGNKNVVTSSDESLRASYGFGLNYYSPIGPIGFTWGFPLLDQDYDIKRMFLFSIGNLN